MEVRVNPREGATLDLAAQLGSRCSVLTPEKARVTSSQVRTHGPHAPPGWLLAAEGTDRPLESAEERDSEDGRCHWGLVLVLEETGRWGSQKARPHRQVTPLQPLALGLAGMGVVFLGSLSGSLFLRFWKSLDIRVCDVCL